MRRRRRPPRRPRRRRWPLALPPSCLVASLLRSGPPPEEDFASWSLAAAAGAGAGAGDGVCADAAGLLVLLDSFFEEPLPRLPRFSCSPSRDDPRCSLPRPPRFEAVDLPLERPPDLPLAPRSPDSPERLRRALPDERRSLRRRLSPEPRRSRSPRLRREDERSCERGVSGVSSVSSAPLNSPPNSRFSNPPRDGSAVAVSACGSDDVGAGVACAMRLTAGSSVLPSAWPILRSGSASTSVMRA